MRGSGILSSAWALLVLVTLLNACRTPPERSVGGGLSIPDQWSAAVQSTILEEEQWWTHFNDTNLSLVVAEVMAFNHDLQAAAARWEAALAQARIAGASLYPSIGFGVNGMREQRNLIGFPFAGRSSDVLTTRSTSYGLNLHGSWELDVWGRVRSGKRAAEAEAFASAADLAAARHSLAARTVKAWGAAIEARQQVGLARSTVESYDLTARQVRQRYEDGIRSPLDLRLALASLAGAKALLETRQITARNTLRQLEILLGRYPSGLLKTADGLPQLPDNIPAGLPAELLARRPDLVAARQRLLAADWRVAESKAALLPRLSLTAGGGTATEELADLLDTDFKVWNVAANLAQPILEGGRLRAGVDLSRARTRRALAEYQSGVLRAFGEVEDALDSESRLAQREKDLAEASLQSAAALRLAQLRYRNGLDTFITVLESQRRALEAETALVVVRRQRLDNRVNLHLALGGGFSMPFEPGEQTEQRAQTGNFQADKNRL